MFFKPIRLTRRRAVFFVLALGVVLLTVILLLGAAERNRLPARHSTVRSVEECAAYLAALGWQTDPESADCRESVLPRTFDRVFSDYAQLQRQQGFDLAAWRGERILIYSLRVTNYGAH